MGNSSQSQTRSEIRCLGVRREIIQIMLIFCTKVLTVSKGIHPTFVVSSFNHLLPMFRWYSDGKHLHSPFHGFWLISRHKYAVFLIEKYICFRLNTILLLNMSDMYVPSIRHEVRCAFAIDANWWASHRRRKEKENEAVRGRNALWQTAYLLIVRHFDFAVVVEPKVEKISIHGI